MNEYDTVGIIGVGLIGGSIGLALRERGLARHVIGFGRNAQRLAEATRLGALTSSTTNLSHGVRDAQVVVVCTPVQQIVDFVQQAGRVCAAGTLITDAGSVKSAICRTLEGSLIGRGHFVGSHPMAGSEKSGAAHASPDLFDGSVTIVTPTENTPSDKVEQTEAFWMSLGSRVVRMAPDQHDQAVAGISHLPHAVAAVLAAMTDEQYLGLVASGWRDTTRVASGDAELWRQIFFDNRAHTLQALDKFAKVLAAFRDALAEEDTARLLAILEAGKQNRDSVAN